MTNKEPEHPLGLDARLKMLDHVYRVYDAFAETIPSACRRGCAHCCTRNVTLTSLEAHPIAEYVSGTGDMDLFERLSSAKDCRRSQPRVTTNELADICLRGEDPPPEASAPVASGCPLLERSECTIYPVRPFHCRCMTSTTNCGETGCADMDPFVVTVNTVFLQYIEHIDAVGCSGNLIDVVPFFRSGENRRHWEGGEPMAASPALIPNRRVSALMIPPRHRARIAPLLQKLNTY